MDANKKEKEGWYPGKYMSRASKRRSVESVQNPSEGTDNSSTANRKTSPNVSKEGKDMIHAAIPDFLVSNPSGSNAEAMGFLTVQILDLKYLRLSSAKLSVQLDKAVSQYSVEGFKGVEQGFHLYDVTSDIKVNVVGKTDSGELLCGIVVIPVTSLLSFSGKPNIPKEQWRQFYPVCISRMTDGRPFKFSPGYADLPGYALNRKEPIGFVSIKIDLDLHDHPLYVYLSKGNNNWKRQLSNFSFIEQDGSVDATGSHTTLCSNAELCAMINRDFSRITSLLRLPLSLTSVRSLPEACVLNVILGCLCFVLDAWQLPLLLVAFCAFNGAISSSQRSYVGTSMWNEPLPLTLVGTPADPNHSSNLSAVMDPLMFLAGAVPTSLNAYPAAAAAAAAIMPPPSELLGSGDGEGSAAGVGVVAGMAAAPAGSRLSTASSSSLSSSTAVAAGDRDRDNEVVVRPSMLRLLQAQNVSLSRLSRTMSNAAHTVEVMINILSFADSRVSILAYAFLSVVAVILSAGLYLMPRISTFAVMSATTLVCATGGFFLDMVDSKSVNTRAAGSAQMEAVSHVLDCLAGFLCRVPDELELTHRYIAGTAVVNVKGSEMSEAGVNFEKRASVKQ